MYEYVKRSMPSALPGGGGRGIMEIRISQSYGRRPGVIIRAKRAVYVVYLYECRGTYEK